MVFLGEWISITVIPVQGVFTGENEPGSKQVAAINKFPPATMVPVNL